MTNSWYVRPTTSHSAVRNGTTYANAWGGWNEIVWSSLAAGDTLFVCGNFSIGAGGLAAGAHGGSAERAVRISGQYASDPGSFTVTASSAYFASTRPNTHYVGLKFTGNDSNALLVLASATNCVYRDNTFVSGPVTAAVSLYPASGQNHSHVTFDGNTFTGTNSTGAGLALSWFVTAGINSTLTKLTLRNNLFRQCTGASARAVVHLRIQDDAAAASKMSDIEISDNTFIDCSSVCLEINSGFKQHGHSTGIRMEGNRFINCTTSSVADSLGGAMRVWGFGRSSDPAFGDNDICRNFANNVVGAAGFANVFYGSYRIFDNEARNLSTTTIDGNGVLFDYGNNGCEAWGNRFVNLSGKASANNSGVGIMVLDSTNISVWSNFVDGCQVGVFYGSSVGLVPPGGQSSVIDGNTFTRVSKFGVYSITAADKARNELHNNIFQALSATAVSVKNDGGAFTGLETCNCFNGFAAPAGYSLNAADITADPQLGDAGVPAAGSPVVGSGQFYSPEDDLLGRRRPNPRSMGAVELM